MNEAEKASIEQICFDIPECGREERRDALEAAVAADDGQQFVAW
jgi:hypothetical protein